MRYGRFTELGGFDLKTGLESHCSEELWGVRLG